jgi:hypothetical protein
MSYWKLEVSMKLGLLGCSRRAVSIEVEKRARMIIVREKKRRVVCLQDVEWARMTQEISEIKIKQDWLVVIGRGVNNNALVQDN